MDMTTKRMPAFWALFLWTLFFVAPVLSASSINVNSTRDVKMVASPNAVLEGFTKLMTVNCSFLHHESSDFSTVMSLILSKTISPQPESQDLVYSEVASITSVARYNVVVKKQLGAQVSGQLVVNDDSYILYQWRYPGTEVMGNWKCEAYGMDQTGHPRVSSAHTQVTESAISMDTVIKKVEEIDGTLDEQKEQLENQREQLNDQREQLDNQRSLLEDQKSIIEDQNARLEEQMLTMENQTKQLRGHKAEIMGLKTKVEAQKVVLDQQTAELNSQKAQLLHQKNQLLNQTGEIAGLKSRLNNQSNHCDCVKMTSQIRDLQNQLNKSWNSSFVASDSYNGHRYYLSKDMMLNVAVFDGMCRSYGGYLTEIDNQQEYHFIVNFLRGVRTTHPVDEVVVIGATDQKHEGTWHYLYSGKAMTYTNWGSGQPNGEAWDCLSLDSLNGYTMYDTRCVYEEMVQFVCEIPN